jgi:hypothetical protein
MTLICLDGQISFDRFVAIAALVRPKSTPKSRAPKN